MGNDRKEYRNWQEKFKNAIDQVDPELRVVLEKIENVVWGKGEEREWLEKKDQVKGIISDARWQGMKRDMYAVLMDKTDGDALLLVRNRSRDGLMGYMRVNKWFTEMSGRGLAERKRAVMRTAEVKREEDIFQAIEQ